MGSKSFKLNIAKILVYIALLALIGFNFYLYRSEFKVLSDPNDGIFHFALIAEAKNVWKNVFSGKLSPFYLLDNWNERWADGFSLALYYSHLPEAVISLVSFITPGSLFQLFNLIRASLIVLLPVSFFFGAQILGFTEITGLIFAFFSQAIITDGLYGIDAPSFLWRGWGLFSQLLAIFILPIAFGYAISYLKDRKNLGKAILFNFLLAQCHLGIFYLLLFAYPLFWLFSLDNWLAVGKRTLFFLLSTFIALAYFIVPFFTTGQYRNFSVWDPIWKFDSWGLKQILIWLFNGNLFDFKRLPFLTIAVFGGVFWGLMSKNKINRYFAALSGVYFIIFIGRDALGPLINIIPGLSEFHLHRTIVMVQFTALYLASIWVASGWKLLGEKKYLRNPLIILLILVLGSYSIYLMEKPVINYASDNTTWLATSNINYQKDVGDYQIIVNKLKSLPPARVFAGRPGNWGNNFKIGDTQVYMALSRDGFSTIGFLPESWSPNSDPEQFFNENDQNDYNLYNVGYLLMPADIKPPEFVKLILNQGKFSLYQVKTDGWFTLGETNEQITSKKTDLLNIIHMWMTSPLLGEKDYPIISLDRNKQYSFVDKIVSMTSLNSYLDSSDLSATNQNIWQLNPLINNPEKSIINLIGKTEIKEPEGYSSDFRLGSQCDSCILVLKQSYHPNWHIFVNGKEQETFPVFPFFIGIKINKPGNYQITVRYQPAILKIIWLFFAVIFFIFAFRKLSDKV